jgi:uncharacterized protein (TIGR03083 family)
VQIPEVYRQTREELVALAGRLDAAQVATPVPATPGWAVRDVYAHLSGVCSDVLDGRMEGGGSPEWTARQLAERAGDDLPTIISEWLSRTVAFEEWLAALPEGAPPFPAFDVWTHQRDITGALGCSTAGDERAAVLSARALSVMSARASEANAPALRVVTAGNAVLVGDGEPTATLSTGDDEVLRIIFGRRSRAQMERAGWDRDPGDALDNLHLFPARDTDLND